MTKRAGKNLRTGFSTGAAASAAAGAAVEALLSGAPPQTITVDLPQGERLEIPVFSIEVLSGVEASSIVIKDAGDDPDVTNKAEIGARVLLHSNGNSSGRVIIKGGPGVGKITKPGLPVQPGEPAINPVPREMIKSAVKNAFRKIGSDKHIDVIVEVFVPRGEQLAKRTLNPRLGIEGGISILGTTGLVKPFSHEAYTATIESALDVARAAEIREIVITTGGKSEKIAMRLRPDLPDAAFIQIADFFGFACEAVRDRKFETLGIVSFFGKAVKQAQGLYYTHAHKAPMDLAELADWISKAGSGAMLAEKIGSANTARHALTILHEEGALKYIDPAGRRMIASARRLAGDDIRIWGKIIDFDSTILFEGWDE